VITYLSQVVTLLAAIAGVLLSPKKKGPDGEETLSPWVWLFLAMPVVAFVVSAWSTTADNAKAEAAKHKAELQAAADKLQAAEDKKNAAVARAELSDLRDRVRASIERVDLLQVDLRFGVDGKDLRWSPKALKDMRDYPEIYSAIHHDRGRQLYGFHSAMYNNWRDVTDDERELYTEMQRTLRPMDGAGGGYLFLAHKGKQNLPEAVKRAVTPYLFTAILDTKKIPADITVYPIDNPGMSNPVPLLPTVSAVSFWAIPDKDAAAPAATVLWTDRLANNRNATMNSTSDFKDVEAAVYIPKPNPNLEGSPSLGAFGEPFGFVKAVDVDAGGVHWGWNQSVKSSLSVMRVHRSPKGRPPITTDVGFVIGLSPGMRGAKPGSW
jgi:hypothetical protein